jgi:nucleoside-diphosphate kinase
MRRTFAMVKSDAVARGQGLAIMADITKAGFRIDYAQVLIPLELELAQRLYVEHEGRGYYDGLINSVTQPCGVIALILSRQNEDEDVISKFRDFIGPSDPASAPSNTLRARYGTIRPDNAIHGSDSAEAAQREIGLFFAHI